MLMTVENCTQLRYLYWVHPYNDFYQKFLEVEHQEKDANIHILVHLLVSFVKFFFFKNCLIYPPIYFPICRVGVTMSCSSAQHFRSWGETAKSGQV